MTAIKEKLFPIVAGLVFRGLLLLEVEASWQSFKQNKEVGLFTSLI